MRRLLYCKRGYTLLEVIVALAITATLMVGVYGLYIAFFKKTSEQELLIEAQQDARVGLNTIQKEVALIGHDVPSTVSPVVAGKASEIEFRYVHPEDGTPLKVTYKILNNKLIRQACQPADPVTWTGFCTPPDWYTIIENLDPDSAGGGLLFNYYDQTGASIAAPVALANLDDIRFVKVTLTTKTVSPLITTGQTKSISVSTEARLRNLYEVSGGGDITAPAQPTGLEVREDSLGGRTGLCGRLRLRWTKDTSTTDIAYYRVFYTLSGLEKNVRVSVTALTDLGTQYEYTLAPGWDTASNDWLLQHTPSDGSALKTYTIGIRAYDNSHNPSALSSEVSGNPSPSRGPSTFGGGANDTTVNPSKLPAVTGFIATDGPSDGKVKMDWDPYSASTYPDLAGFRVYRNTSSFSSYPITAGGSITWLASEIGGGGMTQLTSSATSFTDVGPSLLGCYVYYYAIAPVNCDTTLITDEGGDPAEKKYIASDYTVTYGDGAGSGADSPSGSDTAPPDTASPSAPGIGVRAGWKRVATSLTQSAAADLDQTCVYVNPDTSYPALLASKDANNCFNVNTGATPQARLVPDSGGVFTKAELSQGQSTSFWHDSMTVETPSQPSLAEIGTYSYGAVAFDMCGNGSDVSQAQDTTTLCGEDPQSGEKPPAVTTPAASCCDSDATCCEGEPQGVVLSWTPVPSNLSYPSTPDNPYDLAGYRIFRSTSTDFSTSTMISGSAPYWGSSFQDATATDNGTYYYRIVTTDCPYERLDPSEATIKGHMLDNTLHSVMVGPVYPGRLQRDEKCPSGACTQDNHREVITGIDMNNSSGNGTGASSISGVVISGGVVTAVSSDSYHHNKVTMFFRNTSAGILTIQGASVAWVNSDAYLRKITIGGGRSGIDDTGYTDISASPTTLTPTETDPYTRSISNIDLTDKAIPAGSRYVPITFEFKDSLGTPAIDMRSDKLRVTLNVRNDSPSPGTTSCVSYLTVSQSLEGIDVSTGPNITATQQDKPSSPTSGYAVPGAAGNNTVVSGVDGPIIVDALVPVKVSAVISSNTLNAQTGQRVDIPSIKLYYQATSKAIVDAPTTGYTEVTMEDSLGADCAIAGSAVSGVCSYQIPAEDGMRVWYYMVATDADGNFDRDPERGAGAYVYDQKTFNKCDVTPATPTWISVSTSGLDVTLTWNAVTTYSNGVSLQPGDSITYKLYRTDVGLVATTTLTSRTNTVPVNGVYTYYLTAENTCASPGPRVSDSSDTRTVCAGASGAATLTVNGSSSTPQTILSGESYTVNIMDCLAIGSPHDAHRDWINSALSDIGSGVNTFKNTATTGTPYVPALQETGNTTGTFNTTVQTYVSGGSGNLLVNPTDTVKVCYDYASLPYVDCDVSGTGQITLNVIQNPCSDTPDAPTNLTITSQAQSSVTLQWTKPAATDLAGYDVDERVCKKNRPNCMGSDVIAEWHTPTGSPVVPSPITTSPVSATFGPDQTGNFKTYLYYFRVRAYDTCASPGPKQSAWTPAVSESIE